MLKIHEQKRIDVPRECPGCQDKTITNRELTEALSRRSALVTADKISAHETEFKIPNEKYQHLIDAMQKSSNVVFIIFDKSGIFECAIPDTFRRKVTHVS